MNELEKFKQHIEGMFDDEVLLDKKQEALLSYYKVRIKRIPDLVQDKMFMRDSKSISFRAQGKPVLLEKYLMQGKETNIFIAVLNDFLNLKPLYKLFSKSDDMERFEIILKSKLDHYSD